MEVASKGDLLLELHFHYFAPNELTERIPRSWGGKTDSSVVRDDDRVRERPYDRPIEMQLHIVLDERNRGELLSNQAFNGRVRRVRHGDLQGHLTPKLSGEPPHFWTQAPPLERNG